MAVLFPPFLNKIFSSCNDLPVLNSFLHWNYNSSTNTVDIAFRHTNISSSSWVAWAINPSSKGMIGSQALVAFQGSDGIMRAYTSSVTNYTTQLQEGNLSFAVPKISAEFLNNEITIFATLELPINSSSTVTQLWQEGPLIGDSPTAHPTTGDNVKSIGTLDFLSGQQIATTVGGNSLLRRKNVHGVLNAVSWGTLMPLGAIIARYLKVVNSAGPAWFYLHMTCQHSAYIVGVAGWVTGLKLGAESPGIQYTAHRYIGIVLFCLGTLQVFALLLRPSPDHKYRFYWSIYHHLTGYAVIILSVVNVFKGFDILDPEKKWKRIYIIIISALGLIAVQLEVFTWIRVMKMKKNKSQRNLNEAYGANGYGAKPQQTSVDF
ncbi:Cytochrome b561 [Macleaya cordata]|uniref:Cytochrome b561 n=1 Tax=Macleaya cordata TaxID=56857 RepID=A0A200PUB8_MACCD|nr:Cytochrome b561 [Macleaya cordata]